ncbi:hypothetical protein T492DRAFT_868598, partial [Pavlovales sp. CCMP2436]
PPPPRPLPSPPPPSPSPPPGTAFTLSLTIVSSVADFGDDARASLASALAAFFGVAESFVAIESVTAASVVVIASIFEPSQAGGAGVAALMEQTTAAELSSALSVPVEAKAVRKTNATPPSSSSGGGGGSGGGGSGGLIQSTSGSTSVMSAALGAGIGAGAGVALALALALAVCFFYRRRRRASATVAPARFAEEGASSSSAAKSKGAKKTRPSLFTSVQRRDGALASVREANASPERGAYRPSSRAASSVGVFGSRGWGAQALGGETKEASACGLTGRRRAAASSQAAALGLFPVSGGVAWAGGEGMGGVAWRTGMGGARRRPRGEALARADGAPTAGRQRAAARRPRAPSVQATRRLHLALP